MALWSHTNQCHCFSDSSQSNDEEEETIFFEIHDLITLPSEAANAQEEELDKCEESSKDSDGCLLENENIIVTQRNDKYVLLTAEDLKSSKLLEGDVIRKGEVDIFRCGKLMRIYLEWCRRLSAIEFRIGGQHTFLEHSLLTYKILTHIQKTSLNN